MIILFIFEYSNIFGTYDHLILCDIEIGSIYYASVNEGASTEHLKNKWLFIDLFVKYKERSIVVDSKLKSSIDRVGLNAI